MKLSRDEGAKARGDDIWMLPDLDDKLKKKKKKKKKKKDDSDMEDDWVESKHNKPVLDKAEPEHKKRDDWMEMGMLSTYSRGDTLSKSEKREKETREKEAANVPGSSKMELNPYFAKGGSGIPSAEQKKAPTVLAGDGGVSWLLKAFKRAEEQAKEENIPLEEIAAKRWGSLDRFQEMLAKAKEKAGKNGRNERDKIRGPDTDRYKNRENKRGRGRSRSREKKNNRSKSRERQKERSKSRDRKDGPSRSRERRDGRSRSRDKRNGRSRSRDRRDGRSRSRDRRDGRSRSRSPVFRFSKPIDKQERVSTETYSKR